MLAPPKVVFLCRNNSARSQMAEAMLRQKAGETFDVYSAGSGTKPIKPTVIEVMEEAGFCLDGHYSKKVEQLAHLLGSTVFQAR